MARHSVLAPSNLVQQSVESFRAAATLIAEGHTARAEPLIHDLPSRELRAHYDTVVEEAATAARRLGGVIDPATTVAGSTALRRQLTADRQQTIFVRDGWHCRWCGVPVLAARALRRMHLVFPITFPRDSTNDGRHGLIMAATASVDHIRPLARRGDNDESNLVTACWPCQFARGNWLPQEIGLDGPRPLRTASTQWDGVAWFRD